MDIEVDADCQYDALEIYDGSTKNAPKIGTYCGQTTPAEPIESDTNRMLLHFRSDDSVVGAGFWLTFNMTRRILPECSNTQPLTFEDSSGTINIDISPHMYGVNLICQWRISVSLSKVRIKIILGSLHFSCSCNIKIYAHCY